MRKILFFLLFASPSIHAIPLAEEFKENGYIEIYDHAHGSETYDALYSSFDGLIDFLQSNPSWTQKLYIAKERFIRSNDRNFYSTNIFGFYDESKKQGRHQIAFYYSTHFHEFILSYSPELLDIPEIIRFLNLCQKIQKPCENLFEQAAVDLGLKSIFSSKFDHPPILLKVIKYFPSYTPSKPHYDGTVFSLFLDSTNNESLLLSSYKSLIAVEDFSTPTREFFRMPNQNSILLIPGTLLTEFSIFPTPHIVISSDKIRYATVAFAMRPNYVNQKIELSLLPSFNN